MTTAEFPNQRILGDILQQCLELRKHGCIVTMDLKAGSFEHISVYVWKNVNLYAAWLEDIEIPCFEKAHIRYDMYGDNSALDKLSSELTAFAVQNGFVDEVNF